MCAQNFYWAKLRAHILHSGSFLHNYAYFAVRCQSSHIRALWGDGWGGICLWIECKTRPFWSYVCNCTYWSPDSTSTSCAAGEVCHCFPSGGNLLNVQQRSKMAAMVNYLGRGCILEIVAVGSSGLWLILPIWHTWIVSSGRIVIYVIWLQMAALNWH